MCVYEVKKFVYMVSTRNKGFDKIYNSSIIKSNKMNEKKK